MTQEVGFALPCLSREDNLTRPALNQVRKVNEQVRLEEGGSNSSPCPTRASTLDDGVSRHRFTFSLPSQQVLRMFLRPRLTLSSAWQASSSTTAVGATDSPTPGHQANSKGNPAKANSTPRCPACEKAAYPAESISIRDHTYHKSCFKCVECAVRLTLTTFKVRGE